MKVLGHLARAERNRADLVGKEMLLKATSSVASQYAAGASREPEMGDVEAAPLQMLLCVAVFHCCAFFCSSPNAAQLAFG